MNRPYKKLHLRPFPRLRSGQVGLVPLGKGDKKTKTETFVPLYLRGTIGGVFARAIHESPLRINPTGLEAAFEEDAFGVPEVEQAGHKFLAVHPAGQLLQLNIQRIQPFILQPFQPARGDEEPDPLQLAYVQPHAVVAAAVDDDAGDFGKVLPVHIAPAAGAGDILNWSCFRVVPTFF